jgi:holo-[acyl-carrier protein] synthase
MILGIGTDLVDIRRIEKSLEQYGTRFENRVFTPGEQQYARRNKNASATYAKRFAAKEACYKALGLKKNSKVSWQDIEVVKNAGGGVEIKLTGAAEKHLQTITPPNMQAKIFLSLSDEYPYALAYVIIESISEGL